MAPGATIGFSSRVGTTASCSMGCNSQSLVPKWLRRTHTFVVHARMQNTRACTPQCLPHTVGTNTKRRICTCMRESSYNYTYNPPCTKVKKCPDYIHANWHSATRVFLHPPRAKQWLNDWCDPGKTHEHRVRFGLHLQKVYDQQPGNAENGCMRPPTRSYHGPCR